ncbi:hypothetical protein ACSQ67_003743 [Phaseolus vulgaris]
MKEIKVKRNCEVAFLNQIDRAWPLSHNYLAVHDDSAKLVVDVECIGSRSEPKALLGQEGKHEAQEGIGSPRRNEGVDEVDGGKQEGGVTVVHNYSDEESEPKFDQTMFMQSKKLGFPWK